MRIMSAAGDGGTPLDEAVHQISMIGGSARKKGWFRTLKRDAPAVAEASALTVLSRQLIAGVLVSDVMLERLCALGGQTREQVLGQIAAGVPQQLRISSCALSKLSCPAAAPCCETPNAPPMKDWASVLKACCGWLRSRQQPSSTRPAPGLPRSLPRLAGSSPARGAGRTDQVGRQDDRSCCHARWSAGPSGRV
jgi:hypothetical protein